MALLTENMQNEMLMDVPHPLSVLSSSYKRVHFACGDLWILALSWIFISHIGRAAVTLTSNVGDDAVCLGKMVTYTCTDHHTWQICWYINPEPSICYYPDSELGQQVSGSIQIALTNKVLDPANSWLANLTTTLTMTATPERNGTEVYCFCGHLHIIMSLVLNLASIPSPPQSLSYSVQHYGPHNVTVTVQWGYPEFDGGAPVDNYTIRGTNTTITTSEVNETELILQYSVNQTIEIAAVNCIGSSGTTTFTYFESGCEEPVLPSESFIVTFQSAVEGATITYHCSPGLLPREQMSSVCTNMSWSPDPATLECTEPPPVEPADCGDPPPPVNGFVLPYMSTVEGSVVVFQCDQGFFPEKEMTAFCRNDSQWSPNISNISCSATPTPTSTTSNDTTEFAGSLTGVVTAVTVTVVLSVFIVATFVITMLVITRRKKAQDKHKKEIELQQNICYGPVTTPGLQVQVDSEPSLTELHEEDIQIENNIAYEHTSFVSSGCLPISLEVKSPPSSLPESDDTDLPPPIPPKLFLEEELFPPSPKLSESGEPHCNITPLQEGGALTTHPRNICKQNGELPEPATPPLPPKDHLRSIPENPPPRPLKTGSLSKPTAY